MIEHLLVDHVFPCVAGESGTALHAASVAFAGDACLLIGDSGAGKSSLAAALTLQGGELVADDCAFVTSGEVHALGRGCRLDPDSMERLGLPAKMPDATGKALNGERDGLRIATGTRRVARVVVVGDSDRTLTSAESFAALSTNRFSLQRPESGELLEDLVRLLNGLPPTVEVDRAAPDLLGRIEKLLT